MVDVTLPDIDTFESILMGIRIYGLFISSMILFAITARILIFRSMLPECEFKSGLAYMSLSSFFFAIQLSMWGIGDTLKSIYDESTAFIDTITGLSSLLCLITLLVGLNIIRHYITGGLDGDSND